MKSYILILLTFAMNVSWSQKVVMTPDDVANLKYVVSAVLSEDGSQVAYRQTAPVDPRKENSPTSIYLYLYDLDNDRSYPYVLNQSVSDVSFRPGSNSITFVSKRGDDKTSSLYEISLSGGEAQKIFSFETSITAYQWHPDGQKVAFLAPIKQDTEKELPYQPEIYEENLGKNGLFISDLTEENPVLPLDFPKHVTNLRWSPDGSKIAISAAPTSLVDDFYTSQQIHIVDASNLSSDVKIDHTAKLSEFVWSPDGNTIAFIGGADKHDPIDGRLLLGDPKTGIASILSPKSFEGKFEDISWKDSETLYFLASEGVYTSFGTIDLKGKISRRIDKSNTAFTSFSTAQKTIAMVGNTSQHPGELFILNKGGSTPKRVTISNEWLSNMTLGKQEVITYTTKDGMNIEGIFIHPVDVKDDPVPMITVVHGGPEAHYDNGWLTSYSSPGQVAAGQGYAVFYPNYRGSTGRGLEFAMSSQADPAGKEFDDIIEGLDYLIANKNIDEDRIGVTGGSYGGYATGWMATRHTERFAAGVMFVGISNNLSKWGTSDIPEEMFLVHARKRIWDDYQFFLERSPIYYAGQAKTPLLIMAGKEDTRVDPGQSYELYRHIKTRTDTPVRLVLYPGEGHGNRRATARYDYNLRMMRWFDTYLKNENNKIPETKVEIEGQ